MPPPARMTGALGYVDRSLARSESLHELFEVAADANPSGTAVSFGDVALTYADLAGRANQLARHL